MYYQQIHFSFPLTSFSFKIFNIECTKKASEKTDKMQLLTLNIKFFFNIRLLVCYLRFDNLQCFIISQKYFYRD